MLLARWWRGSLLREVDEAELAAVVSRRIAEVMATMSPEELGVAMGHQLQSTIPEFREVDDEDFLAGLILSCTANVAEIKDTLANGIPADSVPPPADATAWAHELVHRGMSLAALLRAYRLGHNLFDETFERAASEIDLEPAVRWRVLAGAARHVFAYIDSVCTQLVEAYETEREQWLRGAAAAQAQLVQAIVAGEPVDPSGASKTLRYDVNGPHRGFVVWRDGTRPSVPLSRVARRIGGPTALIVPIGEHAVWAWTSNGAAGDAIALEEGTGVAVGGRHEGVDGMCRSHHEARAARRAGDIFGRQPGEIVDFAAVSLSSLISADPDQAATFAAVELGELGGDGAALARLRATIAVYLDENLSPSRTARRLGVHQNTVAYRVKRAEELIGRPLEERRLELEIALRLFDGLDALRAT